MFAKLHEELDQLKSLPPDWDSYGADPPNGAALAAAGAILQGLRSAELAPDLVLPSAEGGVAIAFVRGDRYADVECLNDGDVLIGLSDDRGAHRVWETSLRLFPEDTTAIRDFIQTEHSETYVDGEAGA